MSRELLADKSIDAISVATPNHWHSLITIWGCQAGKDVYVEKPCSHTVFEGRKCVEAARQYGRIVQHGTQSRASELAKIPAIARSGKVTANCSSQKAIAANRGGRLVLSRSRRLLPIWISTFGSGPRPNSPFMKTLSTTIGIGSGISETATLATKGA